MRLRFLRQLCHLFEEQVLFLFTHGSMKACRSPIRGKAVSTRRGDCWNTGRSLRTPKTTRLEAAYSSRKFRRYLSFFTRARPVYGWLKISVQHASLVPYDDFQLIVSSKDIQNARTISLWSNIRGCMCTLWYCWKTKSYNTCSASVPQPSRQTWRLEDGKYWNGL